MPIKDPEKRKEYHNRYNREKWYPENREKHKSRVKKYKERNYAKIKSKIYNISEEELKVAIEKQNGKCAICGLKIKLSVDHCHETGKLRGLLCTRCNTGIGMFLNSTKLLKSAIKYIKNAGE